MIGAGMFGPGPLILLIMTAFGMHPPGPRIIPGLGPHIMAPGLLIGPLTVGLGPLLIIIDGLGPIPHPPVLHPCQGPRQVSISSATVA